MSKYNYLWLSLLIIFFVRCSDDDTPVIEEGAPVSLIAFGSCADPMFDQYGMRIFSAVKDIQPDLYIGLGDNMYPDINFLVNFPWYPLLIQIHYAVLGGDFHFKKMRNHIPAIFTWDDHDYGQDNGGADFPHKQASKEAFMNFYNIPSGSGMRHRDGVYESYYYGSGDQTLQIIMLDTRWNLDVISGEPITPTDDVSMQILGEDQWAWLESELQQPATVRIIGSSIQFGVEANGYENWSNYPHEMSRMFDVIERTRAEGVLFISGDVHYSEVSKRSPDDLYPIYDLTSSGLTKNWDDIQPNRYRIGTVFNEDNFGTLRIDWESQPVTVLYEIRNINGEVVSSFITDLDELAF